MTLPPRSIPERLLPVPTTVSPALQQAIAQPLTATIEAIQTAPADLTSWRQLIATSEATSRERLGRLRQQCPVSVTPESIAGIPCYRVVPAAIAPANQRRLLIHCHGGGYVLASGEVCIGEAVLAAYYGQISVLSIDFRQAPDHPFPAPIEDVVQVWQSILRDYAPGLLGMFGTSAGGGLVLATLLKLQELGLPLPGAIAPLSPWADLSKTSDSLWVNEYVDEIAISYDGLVAGMAQVYAGETDLKHPLVSPLYGDFTGFPPTFLVSGTRDLLLSDTVRVQRKLRQANIPVHLQLFEGLSHAEYLYAFEISETREVFTEMQLFFDQYLSTI